MGDTGGQAVEGIVSAPAGDEDENVCEHLLIKCFNFRSFSSVLAKPLSRKSTLSSLVLPSEKPFISS